MPEELKQPFQDQGKATRRRVGIMAVVVAVSLTALFAFV